MPPPRNKINQQIRRIYNTLFFAPIENGTRRYYNIINEQEFVKLSIFIQQKSDHAVSFAKLASVTSQTINDIAKTLNISPKTLIMADAEMAKIYTEKLKQSQDNHHNR